MNQVQQSVEFLNLTEVYVANPRL